MRDFLPQAAAQGAVGNQTSSPPGNHHCHGNEKTCLLKSIEEINKALRIAGVTWSSLCDPGVAFESRMRRSHGKVGELMVWMMVGEN